MTARDGDLPCCPSGGLLGVGNPIAAAGLMKVAELFWQLRGEAGARQVPGTPERGVAQAWGDLMQVGTVVVLGTDGGPSTTASQCTAARGAARHLAQRRRVPRGDRGGGGPARRRVRWDPGAAIGAFLDGLRDGGSSRRPASSCGRTLVPAAQFCERCFRPIDGWIDVARGHGRDVLDLPRHAGTCTRSTSRSCRR